MKRLLLIALCCIAVSSGADPTSLRAKALIERGALAEKSGDFDEAARLYLAGRTAAEQDGDRKMIAKGYTTLGYVRYYRGALNQALVDLRHAYDLYGAINDVEGRHAALESIAHIYADARVAQYDRAIEYYLQLLPEYQAAGERTSIADTLYNLGSTYEQKGDVPTALDWFRQALAAEQSLGRREEEAYVRRNMGIALGRVGRFDEALPLFDEALKIFADGKNPEGEMQVRQSRGIVLRKMGRLGAAIDDLEATRDFFAATKNTRFLEKSQDELALAYAAAHRWDDAYRARTAHEAVERELAVKLREEHTSRLRVQFDSTKKEQENRALLRQNAAAARIRRLQTIILLLGSIVIAVLIYLAVRLRSIAMTDELTRLPNRRRILMLAEHELQRARAAGEAFSLLAIDIDNFKTINDTYGHAAGDFVLQRVAQTCRMTLGPRDVIGRTGGEEFLALLRSTPLDIARDMAERLRSAVERLDLVHMGSAIRVTISIGLTQSTPSQDTLAMISRRADELLYRAKERGRNRVEVPAA